LPPQTPPPPIIENVSDEEGQIAEAPLMAQDDQLHPDALRQRYDLHLPLHAYTHRTRGEFVAALQQLGEQHKLKKEDLDAMCRSLLQFMPDSVRFCRPVRSAMPLMLVSCPLKPQLAPRVFGWCDECYSRFPAYGIQIPTCPKCQQWSRVHLIATRDVAEVLTLALKRGVIQQHDEIQLLMSVAKYGSTSSVILDVLSRTQSAVRIVAAIMHSPMDIRTHRGRRVSLSIASHLFLFVVALAVKELLVCTSKVEVGDPR
jgi:hypothetical protein